MKKRIKVILCDFHFPVHRTTVVAEYLRHQTYSISTSQLSAAKRRSGMVSGSRLVVSCANNFDLLGFGLEVYNNLGEFVETVRAY